MDELQRSARDGLLLFSLDVFPLAKGLKLAAGSQALCPAMNAAQFTGLLQQEKVASNRFGRDLIQVCQVQCPYHLLAFNELS